MTADTTAARLRNKLVDHLRDQGAVRAERVEAALRGVPRHPFVPAVSLEEAYADAQVHTKHDGAGASISRVPANDRRDDARTAPGRPGQRVLEVGAGTGYNAGLLGHLVGEDGQVITIDVDDDIVAGA